MGELETADIPSLYNLNIYVQYKEFMAFIVLWCVVNLRTHLVMLAILYPVILSLEWHCGVRSKIFILFLDYLFWRAVLLKWLRGNMKKHPSALNSCLYYYYYIYFMLQDTGYWQELLGATGHTSAQLVWLLGQLIHIVL